MFFPTFDECFNFSVEPIQEFLSVLNKSLDGYHLVARWNIVGVEMCNKRRGGGHGETLKPVNSIRFMLLYLYLVGTALILSYLFDLAI